jgi:putative FmdB family regulatory protein
MPRYEFRCRTCASTFEVDRPMSAASDPAPGPTGHDDTVKLLNTVGLGGKARTAQPTGTPRAMASPPGGGGGGGGCCGGGCCS